MRGWTRLALSLARTIATVTLAMVGMGEAAYAQHFVPKAPDLCLGPAGDYVVWNFAQATSAFFDAASARSRASRPRAPRCLSP